MTISSDEYMEVDGIPLQTYAMNVETVGGARRAPGKFRGENRKIPNRRGTRFVKKVPDQRTLSLNMWVRGCDDDGNIPSGRTARALYEQNLDRLMNMMWRGEAQMRLTKRVFVGEALRAVDAMAEFNGGLEPSMIGRKAAKMTVDLLLADPYFYDRNYTTVTLVNGNNTIVVPGTAKTTKIQVTINGARNVTKIRNATYGVESTYNDSLNTGDVALLDVDNFNAYKTPSGQTRVRNNTKIVHQGDPEWLYLRPGTNVIALSSTSGAGAVQLQYKAAWL